MRKFILFTCLSLLLLSGCGDKYKNAEARGMEAIKDFANEYEHGDVLSDADEAEQVMTDIDDKLGDYLTDKFAIELENKIRSSMRNDKDFESDPETFSFFLINEGDGFQFSEFNVNSLSSWKSQDDDVWGAVIYITEHDDNPGWDKEYSKHNNVIMKKESWWDWKVDGTE